MSEKMIDLILSFPKFALTGYEQGKGELGFDTNEIKSIVYAGMGGSAISGDLINELIGPKINIPFQVIRNYQLPEYIDKNTLVILSSFSGNTEETLSCAEQALKKDTKLLGIGSGGTLQEMINKEQFIKLDLDIPPRTAMPMSLFALLRRLEPFYSKKKCVIDKISEAIGFLKEYSFNHNKAKSLAHRINGKIPIFYIDEQFYSVSRRIANQLSENAKHFAHFNAIPEMNHNEIVGLEKPEIIKKLFLPIFIKFNNSMPENVKRADITMKLLENAGFTTEILSFENSNTFINTIDAIMLTDLMSYYLAEKNGVDSMPVERIDALKENMKK